MKKFFLILFLLFFGFSGEVLASSAKSVVETQVEGNNVQVHQVVETTIDGQTVRKESSQPGKLELEMKKTSEESEAVTSIPTQPPINSFFSQIIEFFQRLFSRLKLDNWF